MPFSRSKMVIFPSDSSETKSTPEKPKEKLMTGRFSRNYLIGYILPSALRRSLSSKSLSLHFNPQKSQS